MKVKIIIGILSALIAFNCSRIIESEETIMQINDMLTTYYAAMESKDIEQLMSLFSNDSTVTAVFEDDAVRYVGNQKIRKYYETLFSKLEQIKIWHTDELLEISQHGSVVWISSINHIEKQINDVVDSYNYNFFALFEKRGEMWYIDYIHSSRIRIHEKERSATDTSEKKTLSPEVEYKPDARIDQTSQDTVIDEDVKPDTTIEDSIGRDNIIDSSQINQ